MNSQTKDKSKKKSHFFVWFLVILVMLVVIGLIAVPMYLSSGSGTEMVVGKINDSIGGKVILGNLSVGWFKGIDISGFDYSDDQQLTRITADRISTNPSFWSFLGEVPRLGDTIIDSPKVYLKLRDGQIELPEEEDEDDDDDAQALGAFALVKMDLSVNDGEVTLETEQGEMVRFMQIGAKADLNGINKQNKFAISTSVEDADGQGQGQINAKGQVKPGVKNQQWSLEDTSGDFVVDINSVNLGKLTPLFKLIDPNMDAKGVLDVNMTVNMDEGGVGSIEGRIDGENIAIALPGREGDRLVTNELRADVKIIGTEDAYNFEMFDVVSDWLVINGSGRIGKNGEGKGGFEARYNLDIASAAKAMPQTFAIQKGVEITGGTLNGNLFILTENNQHEYVANGSLEGLQALVDGNQVSLGQPVTFEFNVIHDYEAKSWRVAQGKLSSDFANINVQGTMDQLNYTASANLSALQNQIGKIFSLGGYIFGGQVSEKGVASFKEEEMSFAGRAEFDDLVISKDGNKAQEKGAQITYDMTLNKKANVLNVAELAYQGGAGQLQVSDSDIFMGEGEGETVVNASANVELGQLVPFAIMAKIVPPEYDMQGRFEGSARMTKKGDVVSAQVTDTRVENPMFKYQGKVFLEEPYIEFAFDGRFNMKEKTIAIDSMRLVSPQMSIKKGSLQTSQKGGTEKIDGEFVYDVNLAVVGDVLDPFLPTGFEIYGRLSDTLKFSSEYPEGSPEAIVANLDARTRIGFERAKYMGMNFGPTEIDIEMQNGLMNIKPFTAIVNNGQLKFAANADFKQSPVLLSIPEPLMLLDNVEITKEMTDEMLMYFNPIFANLADVSGVLSFNANSLVLPITGGSKDDVVAAGVVDMNNLTLSGSGILNVIARVAKTSSTAQMKIYPTQFTLADGVLHYDQMTMEIGKTQVSFGGDMYLGGPIDMYVQIPVNFQGKPVRLFFEGTVMSPKLSVEKILQDTLRQQIEGGLRDILQKNL